MNRPSNSILVSNCQRKFSLDIDALARALDAVLSSCGLSGQELSVTLVSPRRMRAMNRTFRSEDFATDVLSFPMREGEGGDASGRLLGDIVLCPAIIHAASKFPRSDGRPVTGTPRKELALTAVHGVLHLLGYNHTSRAQTRQMIALERKLFKQHWRKFPDLSCR